MKKPPKHLFGYDSWIEMYDCLVAENPDLLKARVVFYQYQKSMDDKAKVFKITIRQLMINCWKEIEEKRITREATTGVIRAIELGHDVHHPSLAYTEVRDLLQTIQIQDRL